MRRAWQYGGAWSTTSKIKHARHVIERCQRTRLYHDDVGALKCPWKSIVVPCAGRWLPYSIERRRTSPLSPQSTAFVCSSFGFRVAAMSKLALLLLLAVQSASVAAAPREMELYPAYATTNSVVTVSGADMMTSTRMYCRCVRLIDHQLLESRLVSFFSY